MNLRWRTNDKKELEDFDSNCRKNRMKLEKRNGRIRELERRCEELMELVTKKQARETEMMELMELVSSANEKAGSEESRQPANGGLSP